MNKDFYVIVRAFGDKPEKLRCRVRNGSLMVSREDLDEWLQIPSEFVFEYEENLFSQLRGSFDKNKRAELMKLWSIAKNQFAILDNGSGTIA